MRTPRVNSPDIVTLAHLHAALDGVVEIETLFTEVRLPLETHSSAKRLTTLASEMRLLLVDLLRT